MLSILALASFAAAQYTPLVSRDIPYDQIPYKIDTIASGRGPQSGYNRCNASTVGPDSMCQTAFINSLEDFCLWGLVNPNDSVGNSEASAVAFCTTDAHGTRVIPPGAIRGAQFIQTDEYVQVTGLIDQTAVNIAADDSGGEMDPAGEDQRGNPLGGLMYTTAFTGGNATAGQPTQVRWWTNFMGANIFCIKACVPGRNDARNCEHVYDRSGCMANIPSNGYTRNGTFEQCRGDVGLPVGVYIGGNGRTSTWYQPGEGTPVGALPYNPSDLIPSSSQCSAPSTRPAAFFDPSATTSAASSAAISSASSGASAPPAASTTGQVNAVQPSSGALPSTSISLGLILSAVFGGAVLLR